MLPYLKQYAGQQMLTGQQAEAYADHFIAVHLSEMPYGGVYSKISTAALAAPTHPELAALRFQHARTTVPEKRLLSKPTAIPLVTQNCRRGCGICCHRQR
jgi:hypothetical protein